ncbi:LANO_0H15346g1_1 [Lachancea nothofagi CBS 11611]|uniref:LANO_0H15346g1_1 n=1 Tax=Lachancea nothofagi CBS 11611 TaxID=1266666 RepID=A0A1G4KMJ9_9SACH|nr:LANO_0H15346g1_1 [Lachancea nothofagi CBS 11611]
MVKTIQHTIQNPLGSSFQVLVSIPENEINTSKSPISMTIMTGSNAADQALMIYVYAIPTARDVLTSVLVDTADDAVRETAVRVSKLCAKKSQRPCYLTMAGNASIESLGMDQLLLCKECVGLIDAS